MKNASINFTQNSYRNVMCEMKTPQRAEEMSNIKIMQQDQVSLASNPDDICL